VVTLATSPRQHRRQRLTPVVEILRKLPFLGEEKGHHEAGHEHQDQPGTAGQSGHAPEAAPESTPH